MKPSKEAIEAALQTLPMNDILNGDTSKPVSYEEMKKAVETALAFDKRIAKVQTQAEIISERERLSAEIKELGYQQEILRAHMAVLQQRCKHPNMKTYYVMAESGMTCPDCGYTR